MTTTTVNESAAALAALRENPPAFITVPQAATILQRTPARVYQMIADGTLPVRRIGRAVRLSTVAFLAFIDGEG